MDGRRVASRCIDRTRLGGTTVFECQHSQHEQPPPAKQQVHSLLVQQQKLLQGSVDKLRKCLKASDQEAERVMALQAKLEKDFEVLV